MTKHPIFGELTVVTLAILRMTRVAADFTPDGWFAVTDVARPISELVGESDIREFYKTLIRHEVMDDPAVLGGVQKYHLTQRGVAVLEALLSPSA